MPNCNRKHHRKNPAILVKSTVTHRYSGYFTWEHPCGHQGAVSRSGALLPSPPSHPLPSPGTASNAAQAPWPTGTVPGRKPPIWFQLKETILKTIQSQFQARQFPAPHFRKLLSKYRRSLAAAQAALFLGCGR